MWVQSRKGFHCLGTGSNVAKNSLVGGASNALKSRKITIYRLDVIIARVVVANIDTLYCCMAKVCSRESSGDISGDLFARDWPDSNDV